MNRNDGRACAQIPSHQPEILSIRRTTHQLKQPRHEADGGQIAGRLINLRRGSEKSFHRLNKRKRSSIPLAAPEKPVARTQWPMRVAKDKPIECYEGEQQCTTRRSIINYCQPAASSPGFIVSSKTANNNKLTWLSIDSIDI